MISELVFPGGNPGDVPPVAGDGCTFKTNWRFDGARWYLDSNEFTGDLQRPPSLGWSAFMNPRYQLTEAPVTPPIGASVTKQTYGPPSFSRFAIQAFHNNNTYTRIQTLEVFATAGAARSANLVSSALGATAYDFGHYSSEAAAGAIDGDGDSYAAGNTAWTSIMNAPDTDSNQATMFVDLPAPITAVELLMIIGDDAYSVGQAMTRFNFWIGDVADPAPTSNTDFANLTKWGLIDVPSVWTTPGQQQRISLKI